ncbi:septum site-determining protein MinC [Roseibium alexandrii]|uniref:Probable septum site-determining protein MinC n=1 Tax=Roseibium alexandrii TaxID=388408 RepID=A0A0M7AH74_9HYPH|nr:septum site-determining protein MinC [Roseibium alexandrii]CTQ72974.1 Septum site-determining protein MinC [Roseibium alexandrii]
MKFKGKSFIAIVLSPEPPYQDWFKEIDRIIARTPGFFIDRPIVLDVRGTKIPIEELETVLEGLSARSIRVFGIDGISGTRLKPGMPPSFGGGRLTADVEIPETAAADAPETAAVAAETLGQKTAGKTDTSKNAAKSNKPAADPATKTAAKPAARKADRQHRAVPEANGSSIVITEHVRSGQSILHPDGDVTIVGSVSSGAEIIAGGSIHVYGALRGRALAGVSGRDGARIFCSKLDAELVSINGLYKVADDFEPALRDAPAQIRFENESLVFEQLS